MDERTTPILFYSPGTCALAAIVGLEWAGVPYRLCRVTREERQGEAYRRAVNENGQVPALRLAGGTILTENAALLPWIADRRPEQRLAPPCGSPERYELYRWLAWLDSTFHSAHVPFFAPGRYLADEAWHDRVREQALRRIAEQLARVERHLAGRQHVLLERRTVLDPYLFVMLRWTAQRLDHASRFPNLAAFSERLGHDEAVQRMLEIERGGIVDPPGPPSPFEGHVPWNEIERGG